MTVTGASTGPSVDAHGEAVLDPTENVKALTKAAVDGLRNEVEIRAYYTEREAAANAAHAEQLRAAESRRIDANRAQDQDNARRDNESAKLAVQALATQVPIIAETVRASLATTLDPMRQRLDELSRNQYEQAGQKSQSSESKSDRNVSAYLAIAVVGVVLAFFSLVVAAVAVGVAFYAKG